MGIFGWSYPPGCDGPPDEYYDDSEKMYKCPKCGGQDNLRVLLTLPACSTQDEDGNLRVDLVNPGEIQESWDEESSMSCVEEDCDFTGVAQDFINPDYELS